MRTIPLALIFLLSITCLAQEHSGEKTYKNSLYFNPLSPFVKTVNFSYERFLNQRFSVRIGFVKGKILPEGKQFEATRSFLFTGGLLEVRKYMRVYPGKTTEDFYLGPYAQLFNDRIIDYEFSKDNGISRDSNGLAIANNSSPVVIKAGLMAGSRQILFKRIALDVNAGIHYQLPTSSVETSTEIVNLMARQGVSFRIGLNIGYCF